MGIPPSRSHGVIDSGLEWVETTVLWERPLGEAVSSDAQTDGRISHLHLMLRLYPDTRGVEFRGTPLGSFILPGPWDAL